MLAQFTAWLVGLVKACFTAIWDFVTDAAIHVFTLLLNALAAVVAAIPMPDFLAHGLGSLFGGLPPSVLYMVTACGVVPALGLVGAGYSFRLLRKVLTLFQW